MRRSNSAHFLLLRVIDNVSDVSTKLIEGKAGLFSAENATPFFPNVFYVGDSAYVRFNQGYIVNYGSQRLGPRGSLNNTIRNLFDGDAGFLDVIPVTGGVTEIPGYSSVDSLTFSLTSGGGDKFYVEIIVDQENEDFKGIISAKIIKYPSVGGELPSIGLKDFHDNIGNTDVDENGEPLQYQGKGYYRIALCEFNSSYNPVNIILRENIHWQKFNFKNLGGNSEQGGGDKYAKSGGKANVLYSWGSGIDDFGENPVVKVRQIIAGENIYITYDDDSIKINSINPVDNSDQGTGNEDIPFQFPSADPQVPSRTSVRGLSPNSNTALNLNKFSEIRFGSPNQTHIQSGIVTLVANTIDDTPVSLTPEGDDLDELNPTLDLPVWSLFSFNGIVSVMNTQTAKTTQSASWEVKGTARTDGYTTKIVTSQVVQIGFNNIGVALRIEPHPYTKGIKLVGEGTVGEELRWAGSLNYKLSGSGAPLYTSPYQP